MSLVYFFCSPPRTLHYSAKEDERTRAAGQGAKNKTKHKIKQHNCYWAIAIISKTSAPCIFQS